MKTIVIILLLIFVSVGVIAVYFPDIINNTTPSILQPDTQQTTTKPPTKEQTTKPPSKCVTGFFVKDMYPPKPTNLDPFNTSELLQFQLDLLTWTMGKSVNDINECKNECDKYTGCKSYSYNSGNKLCWLGSSFTFEPASEPSLVTSCVK